MKQLVVEPIWETSLEMTIYGHVIRAISCLCPLFVAICLCVCAIWICKLRFIVV